MRFDYVSFRNSKNNCLCTIQSILYIFNDVITAERNIIYTDLTLAIKSIMSPAVTCWLSLLDAVLFMSFSIILFDALVSAPMLVNKCWMSCADLTLVDGELSCITAATYRFWLCRGIIPWMVLCMCDTRWVKACNVWCETKLEKGQVISEWWKLR